MLNYNGGYDSASSDMGVQKRREPVRHVANKLLASLPPEILEALLVRMELVNLKRRQILEERNFPLTYAYFLESGAASLLAKAGERSMIEVRTLGSMDLVGVPIVLGTGRSPHRCVVQIAGKALRIVASDLANAMERWPELRRILLAYVQAALVHSSQLVACNTRHSLSQRLARWLLVANDELKSSEIILTHDLLSRALGVRRAGVTLAIGKMEAAGVIRHSRGRIEISDRDALEEASCDCYRAIRTEHERTNVSAAPKLLQAARGPA